MIALFGHLSTQIPQSTQEKYLTFGLSSLFSIAFVGQFSMHNPPSGQALIPLQIFSSIVTATFSPIYISDNCFPPTPTLSGCVPLIITVIASTGIP